MNNGRYYIGTGAKECFYTLRYTFREPWGETVIERDYHVCNLSTDRETAIAKAHERTGKPLDAEFEVRPITRRQDIDWSILQGGKYIGKSIHEVRETDPNYLLWLCGQNCDRKRYSQTIELLRVLMAHELKEKEDQERIELAELTRKRAQIAERCAPIIAVLEKQNGDFCSSIARDLGAGHKLSERPHRIVCDIFAKSYGRRNSKAYDEAYNRADEILAYCDK
jgi:hypothetical protein